MKRKSKIPTYSDDALDNKYYKYVKIGLSVAIGVVIIGTGAKLLATSVRSVNDLKAAINGN